LPPKKKITAIVGPDGPADAVHAALYLYGQPIVVPPRDATSKKWRRLHRARDERSGDEAEALINQWIQSMTGFGRAAGALSSRYFVAVTAKERQPPLSSKRASACRSTCGSGVAGARIASDTFSRRELDISFRVQRTAQPEYNVRINAQLAGTVVPQLSNRSPRSSASARRSPGSDLLRVSRPAAGRGGRRRDHRRGSADALAALVRDAFAQMPGHAARGKGVAARRHHARDWRNIRELQQGLSEHREEIRGEMLAAYQQRVQGDRIGGRHRNQIRTASRRKWFLMVEKRRTSPRS